jgi:hypothetical protein
MSFGGLSDPCGRAFATAAMGIGVGRPEQLVDLQGPMWQDPLALKLESSGLLEALHA